jgi:hypothetical protein
VWLHACLTSAHASCNPGTWGQLGEFLAALTVIGLLWLGVLLLIGWLGDWL